MGASAAGVERQIGVQQVAVVVVLYREVALVDVEDRRQGVEVGYELRRPRCAGCCRRRASLLP